MGKTSKRWIESTNGASSWIPLSGGGGKRNRSQSTSRGENKEFAGKASNNKKKRRRESRLEASPKKWTVTKRPEKQINRAISDYEDVIGKRKKFRKPNSRANEEERIQLEHVSDNSSENQLLSTIGRLQMENEKLVKSLRLAKSHLRKLRRLQKLTDAQSEEEDFHNAFDMDISSHGEYSHLERKVVEQDQIIYELREEVENLKTAIRRPGSTMALGDMLRTEQAKITSGKGSEERVSVVKQEAPESGDDEQVLSEQNELQELLNSWTSADVESSSRGLQSQYGYCEDGNYVRETPCMNTSVVSSTSYGYADEGPWGYVDDELNESLRSFPRKGGFGTPKQKQKKQRPNAEEIYESEPGSSQPQTETKRKPKDGPSRIKRVSRRSCVQDIDISIVPANERLKLVKLVNGFRKGNQQDADVMNNTKSVDISGMSNRQLKLIRNAVHKVLNKSKYSLEDVERNWPSLLSF